MKNGVTEKKRRIIRFIDLFCGIGGFRIAAENAAHTLDSCLKCVLSSDIDSACQDAYESNFGERPLGDIAQINASDVPDHDLLLAGFPCQPFSVIGKMRGFDDTQGTLFFDIARILDSKRPRFLALENVKTLAGHDKGNTLRRIVEILEKLGYNVMHQVLNALDFGLPQKRERIFIVGFHGDGSFEWPTPKTKITPLSDILEKKVSKRFLASEHIRKKRLEKHAPTKETTIWHENKSGHVSAYPFSCALRAGASYNYLLVNGKRRLTPREMLRLQGFPDSYKITCSDHQTRRQAGNSLPVPVAQRVLCNLLSGD